MRGDHLHERAVACDCYPGRAGVQLLDLPAVTELAEQSCQLARAGGSGSVLVLAHLMLRPGEISADRLRRDHWSRLARQPPPRGAPRLPELRRREGHPVPRIRRVTALRSCAQALPARASFPLRGTPPGLARAAGGCRTVSHDAIGKRAPASAVAQSRELFMRASGTAPSGPVEKRRSNTSGTTWAMAPTCTKVRHPSTRATLRRPDVH
jgi:hypothetical protein